MRFDRNRSWRRSADKLRNPADRYRNGRAAGTGCQYSFS